MSIEYVGKTANIMENLAPMLLPKVTTYTGDVVPIEWFSEEFFEFFGRGKQLPQYLMSHLIYMYQENIQGKPRYNGVSLYGKNLTEQGTPIRCSLEEYALRYGESKFTIKSAFKKLSQFGLIHQEIDPKNTKIRSIYLLLPRLKALIEKTARIQGNPSILRINRETKLLPNKLPYKGYIIPSEWFHKNRYFMSETGKFSKYLSAIVFAYIVNWNKLDKNGQKKFSGNALSLRYRNLSKIFGGICHNSIREVIKHFEEKEILKRVICSVKTAGQYLANVMHIVLDILNVRNITNLFDRTETEHAIFCLNIQKLVKDYQKRVKGKRCLKSIKHHQILSNKDYAQYSKKSQAYEPPVKIPPIPKEQYHEVKSHFAELRERVKRAMGLT